MCYSITIGRRKDSVGESHDCHVLFLYFFCSRSVLALKYLEMYYGNYNHKILMHSVIIAGVAKQVLRGRGS